MLQTSRLTTKYQATVPTSVRKLLQLKAGDLVGFEIEGNEVRLRRATPLDVAFTRPLKERLLSGRASRTTMPSRICDGGRLFESLRCGGGSVSFH